MLQVNILNNNDPRNVRTVSCNFDRESIEDIIGRYDKTLNEMNTMISVGDEIIRDWSMPIINALHYGDYISVYCYNIQFTVKRGSDEVSIMMDSRESIYSLKKRIKTLTSMKTCYQRLVKNGKVLSGGSLWSNLIDNDSVVNVKDESVEIKIKVFIVLAAGASQLEKIQVYPTETVGDIKRKVTEKLEVDALKQKLELNSIELDDSKTAMFYNLNNSSVLDLYFNENSSVKSVITFFSKVSNEEFIVKFDSATTVSDMRQGLNMGLLHYKFNGTFLTLENERKISDYGLMNNIIPVVYNPPGYLLLTGKYAELKNRRDAVIVIKSKSSVEKLKRKLSLSEGLDVNQLQLMLEGIRLRNEKTLEDYAIQSGAVIELLLRPVDDIFIELQQNPTILSWDKSAAVWRLVENGLCLEGRCTNQDCMAFKHLVIMNMGNPVCYQIGIDLDDTKCPVCSCYVKPTKCAFNNCYWRYIGIIGDENDRIKSPWKKAGNTYHKFEEASKNSWKSLLVETKSDLNSMTETAFCGVCLQSKPNGIRDCEACKNCKKKHHKICMGKWKKSSKGCPSCQKPVF